MAIKLPKIPKAERAKRGSFMPHRNRLYLVWANMLARCRDRDARSFPRYGGRGINVWWQFGDFNTFYRWAIANGYQPGLQLDRRNNDVDYSPHNCRFVTSRQNTNNRRVTVRLSDGTPLADAIRVSGLNESTVRARLRLGWSPDDAVSAPAVDWRKHFLSDGTPLADAIWASGLNEKAVYARLRLGWSPDDAVSAPAVDGRKHFLSDGTPLADAIRAFGLNEKTVYTRLRLGWSPDDAVSAPVRAKRPAVSAPSTKGKGRK